MLSGRLIGSDLFDNKFDEAMLKEAKRLKTDERIDLRRQAPGSSSSWSALTAGKESKSGQRSFRRPYSTKFRQPKATSNHVPTKPSFRRQTFTSTKTFPSRSTRSSRAQGTRGYKGQ